LIYPPDKTVDQVEQENAQQFAASQTSAETAALRELGFPVQVTIAEIQSGRPAEAALKVNDVITTVDGEQVTTAQKLSDLIRAKPAGTALSVGYTRDGKPGTATVTSVAAEDGTPVIGVRVEQKQPHPFTLKIELDEIGGPSAGLMFALGIIDKLEPEDLTGGLIVAGTGTIDDEGRVGPIGGVPQKLVAARAAKATAFFTPADNCAEAVANAVPDLKLVKIGTLDDALAALEALRAGREPTLCPR
jgi:PDZ domain-containing protein